MQQFRLFRGKSGCFFIEDTKTKKQSSLRTRDEGEAERILSAKKEAHQAPVICLQMARVYLTAADPIMGQRTWQMVMDLMGEAKTGIIRQTTDDGM